MSKINQQINKYKQQQQNYSPNNLSSNHHLESNSSNQTIKSARLSPKSIQIKNNNNQLPMNQLKEANLSINQLDDQATNNNQLTQELNDHENNSINLNNDKELNDKSNDKTATKKEKGEKDSPAFRLRARRSTPRKLENSIYSSPFSASRKSSLYSVNDSDQLQAKVAKLKKGTNLNDVKRNLFESTDKDQQLNKSRRLHSPSRSLVENVDLNVFAENKLVEQLTEVGKNNLNYLSLRIIEVLNEEFIECSTNCSANNSANDQQLPQQQKLLKIYCQQAETKTSLNIQKPVILLYLFNEYCNFKDKLIAGKIIEIVKFEVKQLITESLIYKSNSIDIPIHPFYIEIKPDRTAQWISVISIKKRYEPANSNLLNVINTQSKHYLHDNIEDQPPTKNPRVVFSSYVVSVKNESAEQSNHLENTKSPTLKRFMRTINKSYAQDSNKLKLKIKKEKY